MLKNTSLKYISRHKPRECGSTRKILSINFWNSFYINYHNHQDKLLNQFASRRYLLNVDESKELSDCIKIGRLKTEVDTHINILQRSIPDYTFDDFIIGKVDLSFANWGMGTLLREENINRIRAWQEAAVIDIANYESVLLIKKCKFIAG